ncbi:MetQ/NlpA family ABC transporter substrate-binding protein [Nosocomiicoccus ampullae]|uniref:D-methionine transport system substrate-binding protein n=1 Tax=Nosocomiicoccus ampullae TaxID=489910 RepID=A0A9Q2CYU4_9STAP|nr:MetQ/NlpA family ABC transporter substrate-binding protein [Nosocomiicoccus ampullae]MBB5175777.1 D-methionine transport system substrate-binding protein [Nosocomiicoccus ampullae]QYA47161.1 methionine ABC transporter substrate-binding protein [Nosocomiicoccus ampullae]QYA48788.1 methionine ABC transporter substrate-binding protein [Nosocomiicoccus ampullae]
MKRFLFALVLLFTVTLAACNNSDDSSNDSSNEEASNDEVKKLTVVATPVPHAEILEEAKPLLEDKGIDLDIKVVNDYNTPNQMLESGDANATFFAHIPYFNNLLNEGFDFENIGPVHLEPIGAYSNDYDSLEDLPDGAKVLISNNLPDEGRVLKFFVDHDLITLKDGVDPIEATLDDIEENPHDFKFDNQTAPEIMVKAYENNEGDVFFINSNYAIDSGLSPKEEAIELEAADSDYVNVVIVRSEDKDDEALNTLVEVLQSDDIKSFIDENYDGAVISAE